MNANKLNNANYITYSTTLKPNLTVIPNISNNQLAKEKDRVFRKEDFVNVINKSIVHANKMMRRLRQYKINAFPNENIPEEELLYNKLIPIGITEQVEHPITKKLYDIYGYPRRFAGDTIFGCRGKRTIKGSKNVLHNNIKQCISINDLNRISLKAITYSPYNNSFCILVLLDNDKPISIIDDDPTFLNSLTKKEKDFVNNITSQAILSVMYRENKVYSGQEFVSNINMGVNKTPLIMPSKEHIPKLRMNTTVRVKEIPSWRNMTGGHKKKRITRRHHRKYRK
jgi:hypothetical protein